MRIACDVHTHTLASHHAYSTLAECVGEARRRGIDLIGSTDHFSAMISATLDVRDYQHFLNFGIWPRVWDGVRVLRGVEADIVDLDGHLFGFDLKLERGITGRRLDVPCTLKDLVFSGIDYAIASVHDTTFAEGATIGRTTDMYVGALDDPAVIILGHIGRAGVPFDLDTVLLAARERHKLIEINEHSFAGKYGDACHARCRKILERAAELGVSVSCGTDAHISCEVGDFRGTQALLEEVRFPPELVACAHVERFCSFLPAATARC